MAVRGCFAASYLYANQKRLGQPNFLNKTTYVKKLTWSLLLLPFIFTLYFDIIHFLLKYFKRPLGWWWFIPEAYILAFDAPPIDWAKRRYAVLAVKKENTKLVAAVKMRITTKIYGYEYCIWSSYLHMLAWFFPYSSLKFYCEIRNRWVKTWSIKIRILEKCDGF